MDLVHKEVILLYILPLQVYPYITQLRDLNQENRELKNNSSRDHYIYLYFHLVQLSSVFSMLYNHVLQNLIS